MDNMNRLIKSEWKVAPLGFATAGALVARFHYAKTASKQSVALHGLFMACDDYCVLPYGVCWWIPLPSAAAAKFFHEDYRNVLALSRMVLTPDAPKNAASFLLSRSIKLLPERYHTLATYADSWQGHTGNVYRACNWQYRGISDGKPVWVNPSGEMVSTRRGQRTLTKDEMLAEGYVFKGYHVKHRYSYQRYEVKVTRQLSLPFAA